MTNRALHSVILATIVVVLLVQAVNGATLRIVRGNDQITIDNDVPFLQLRDAAKATVTKGAEVSHLQADGSVEIVLEKDSKVSHLRADGSSKIVLEKDSVVSHLTLSGNSVLRVSGGSVGCLTLEGNSQAHIRDINIIGGFIVPGVSINGRAIVYTSGVSLHIYANNLAFSEGKLTGNWSSGERFLIWMIECIGPLNGGTYRKPQSLPTQLVAHELPDPSFDCNKAITTAEKIVCADEKLSHLDKQLSQTYKQVLAVSSNVNEVRQSQRNWLIGHRNKCTDKACLEKAYDRRISEIVKGTMTNAKAQAICNTIVGAVNDGTIMKRFESFRAATQKEQKILKESQPDLSNFYVVSRALKINSKGNVRTIGLIQGGGTCSACYIIDIAAKETERYPPDDDKERLRWAGWGECDYFLFVDGEPIIMTGNFGWGESSASLVTWLAPDGAKRALCYLGPSGEIKTNTVHNEDLDLCQAVTAGSVKSLPWPEPVSVAQEKLYEAGIRADSGKGVVMDIDMDGKKEMIALFDYVSSAGCGSFHQWLLELTSDGQSVAKSQLSDILKSKEWGPIKGAPDNDLLFSVKLFLYKEKPYILGRGNQLSAEVVSVWGSQQRVWCEYQLLPQHEIEVFYPIETWPLRVESSTGPTK
jgi:uncharacterized protein YecT (DUF1311 family)